MKSKQCIVTGASEGIGRAFAQQLAKDGWQVIAVARSESRLQSLVRELPGEGHTYIKADLATEAGIATALECIRLDRPQLLINNAGITHYGPFADVPLLRQQEVLTLNTHALTALAHGFLQTATPGAALINTSSILAFMPQPTSAVYAASKAFVTCLSQALWYEYKHKDIYVAGLHPGVTKGTEFRARGGGKATRAPWALHADEVARIGIHALQRRAKHTIICGTTNNILARIAQWVPKTLLIRTLGSRRSRAASKWAPPRTQISAEPSAIDNHYLTELGPRLKLN